MKNVVIEIDGVRHKFKKTRKNAFECEKCSLTKLLGKNIVCVLVKILFSYILKKKSEDMAKDRYTLVRVFRKQDYFARLDTEEIECKTLKEAVELGSILTNEEKMLGSYIFDNVRREKLTLRGD
jgi:hypothetical protein